MNAGILAGECAGAGTGIGFARSRIGIDVTTCEAEETGTDQHEDETTSHDEASLRE